VTEPRHAAPDEEQPQVVVHDRRRIDPETGEVRAPAHAAEDEGAAPVSEEPLVAEVVDEVAAELKTQLDERTADLQRLTAEYANYRKRVERDREAVINNAKASVAAELLSVLDDVERAAAHGDLTGAFKAVADKLVSTLQDRPGAVRARGRGVRPVGARGRAAQHVPGRRGPDRHGSPAPWLPVR
jgi:molecular chaperone GrpE